MTRTKFALSVLILLSTLNGTAQNQEGITHSGQKTGQAPYPVLKYSELPNPVATDSEAWKGYKENRVSWGSTDVRYKKERPIPIDKVQIQIKLYAWEGERVSAQWVVSAFNGPLKLSYSVSDLIHTEDSLERISPEQIMSGFVRYVMTEMSSIKTVRAPVAIGAMQILILHWSLTWSITGFLS